MSQSPLLKQFCDLIPTDFAGHPVWVSIYSADYDEPWYADSDEETFRAWNGELPIAPENGMFLVRSEMALSDGRLFSGFITPQHDGEPLHLGIVQPQLFLPSGKRCNFWDGKFKRDAEDLRTIYAELGSKATNIFPIRFSVKRGLASGQTTGLIPGICWCPDKNVQVYY